MHIVIEGQDCTGKNTEAALLANYFKSQGKEVILYSESGSDSEDEFTKTIATLNYGSAQNIDHRTRVLLFLVNRYNQWHTLAEPVLRRDGIVITTRSWYSTLIYEGYAGGVSKSLIIKLHKLIMPERYFHPDKIVFLTLDDEERTKRLNMQDKRFEEKEVFKSKNQDFQDKLNHSYLVVAKKENIPTLDATGTPEEVFKKIKTLFKI